ncbi:class I SAM-dependent methyltransferase [Baekduia sp. Peel2402]|uniref:class I SAM-dependent methyltransferase n=1 Tax=Baekduia sp. Peel2402 TaxID=3458296 RepID=UPI00403E80A4
MELDADALSGLNDHEARNRAWWNEDAPRWVTSAERNWAVECEPHWGIWHLPESDVRMLPMGLDGVDGLDLVELGCGTAYWSAWLARRGARPVGVDLSENQLVTARAMQERHGLSFPLVHASAEDVPLDDASFDLAFSEYGAAIWCEPRAWIGEAARLLRPGGWLVFLAGSVLAMLTAPPLLGPSGETLQRPMAALRRMEWDDDPTVEFHLPHGEMLDLLRETGFEDVRLRELYAPEGDDEDLAHFATRGWSRKWPVEEIWAARRRA